MSGVQVQKEPEPHFLRQNRPFARAIFIDKCKIPPIIKNTNGDLG